MVGEASKDFEAGNALQNVLNIDLCLTVFDIPTGTEVWIPLVPKTLVRTLTGADIEQLVKFVQCFKDAHHWTTHRRDIQKTRPHLRRKLVGLQFNCLPPVIEGPN